MIKTFVTIERRTAKGKIIASRIQKSRSWTLHFFDLLYPLVGGGNLSAINDITATPQNIQVYTIYGQDGSDNLIIGSPSGGVTAAYPKGAFYDGDGNSPLSGENFGIVIGTDPTAVTPQDNALVAKIAHGETAGKILYGGTELYGLTFANPNGSMNIRRYFTNVLGGNLSVAECGIYSPANKNSMSGAQSAIYCISRDVVSPAVVVANGEILSVIYTVTITV
jgi:hypothetical protein